MNQEGKGNLSEASIAVKVIRADGTSEDRGVVAYWSKSRVKRLRWRLAQWRRS